LSPPNPQELHSLGFGLRTGFKGAQLDLAAAIPVTRLYGQASRPAPLFLATFTAMILPWRYR
jgi:hypothetical protein